ncbi:MAG: hypothetical protein ACRC30_01720 [Clostridium sp.]
MTKEEKLRIYIELFNNTRGNKGKILLNEAISNIRENKINKLDKYISKIDLNIAGFGIKSIEENEIVFIKYEENLEEAEELLLIFKIKDEGKVKIYDYHNIEVSSVGVAIEGARGTKLKRYYYVEVFRENNLSMQIYYNINCETTSDEEAREWAGKVESNCQVRYSKEQRQLQFNQDMYLNVRTIRYTIDLDENNVKNLTVDEFRELLDEKLGDSDMLIFRKEGEGTFAGIYNE